MLKNECCRVPVISIKELHIGDFGGKGNRDSLAGLFEVTQNQNTIEIPFVGRRLHKSYLVQGCNHNIATENKRMHRALLGFSLDILNNINDLISIEPSKIQLQCFESELFKAFYNSIKNTGFNPKSKFQDYLDLEILESQCRFYLRSLLRNMFEVYNGFNPYISTLSLMNKKILRIESLTELHLSCNQTILELEKVHVELEDPNLIKEFIKTIDKFKDLANTISFTIEVRGGC